MREHISYSELVKWMFCPYHHKLVYIENLKGFTGNIYTAFGNAIHEVCEQIVLDSAERSKLTEHFSNSFETYIDKLDHPIEQDEKDIFSRQGLSLIPEVLPALKEKFGDYQVVSTEEEIYEDFLSQRISPYKVKGFIDLVIKTKDEKIHIIDWKTCSWGWDARKKSSKEKVYQLSIYKHFFCKKHNVEPDTVETHFALLKRTGKKDKKVEIFRVTSGKKRVDNAIKLLERAVEFIQKKKYLKNRMSCDKCEFYGTKHCQ